MKKYYYLLISISILVLYLAWSKSQVNSNFNNDNSYTFKLPKVDLYSSKSSVFKILDLERSKFVLHFWATWCAPCSSEFLELIRFAESNPSFTFLLVAVNNEDKDVSIFLKRFKLPSNVVVLFDYKSAASNAVGALKLPETFYVGQNFIVRKKFSGPQAWASGNYFQTELNKL